MVAQQPPDERQEHARDRSAVRDRAHTHTLTAGGGGDLESAISLMVLDCGRKPHANWEKLAPRRKQELELKLLLTDDWFPG